MKVVSALFSDYFVPNMNSTSVIVKNHAYWLNKNYGKSIVVTPNDASYLDAEDFEVLRYKNIKDTTNNLAESNVNIVHAHSTQVSLKMAYTYAKKNNLPIIASLNNKDYENIFIKNNLLSKIAIKRLINLYHKMNLLLVPSKKIFEDLITAGYKGQIDILENGSDFYLNNVVNREYINHKYEINEEVRVLLYVGELSWQKNIKIIVDSLINLRKIKQDFRMFFIGDGDARDEIIKLVNEHKLNKYVVFTGIISDRNLLKRYFERANLLLFPSMNDTVGQAVIEAASFKIPTLLIKDSNVSDKIKDYHNGYLSENNSLSYAQKIIASLNDKNNYGVGLEANKTLVISFEKIVDKLYQKYCEIINSR